MVPQLYSAREEIDCRPQHTVGIEPSLPRESPKNGNIGGSRRRLLPKWHASLPIWELRDRRRIAKARQQRAFLLLEG
jgi:hypothetical protein